jgi:hypothetical protein
MGPLQQQSNQGDHGQGNDEQQHDIAEEANLVVADRIQN